MKKLICLSMILLLALCSCGNKKVYHPSHFPVAQSRSEFSFSVPYEEKRGSIVVRVRLNGGPQFEGVWDTGCGLPLKITNLEATTLVKAGTLSTSDKKDRFPVRSANGQENMYDVYLLKSISFTDDEGEEHTVSNVPAIIDDNIGTDILIGLPVMQALANSNEISQNDQKIYFKD